MSINSINTKNDKERREEARGKRPQTTVEKQVSEIKDKVHNILSGKK